MKWLALARERIEQSSPVVVAVPPPRSQKPKKHKKHKQPHHSTADITTQQQQPKRVVEEPTHIVPSPPHSLHAPGPSISPKLSPHTEPVRASSHPLLWIQAFIIFIILVPLVWSLAGRISVVELELRGHQESQKVLEMQVMFLRTFVEVLSENITGRKASLQEHAMHWKTRPEMVTATLSHWKEQLDTLHSEVIRSKKFLELAASFDNLPSSFHEPHPQQRNQEEPPWSWWSWGWRILLSVTLATSVGWIVLSNKESLYSVIRKWTR